MGTLADSLFNVLMSWVRALVNSIWALFTTDHMTLLEFLGKNWVMLVVIMLAAGLVMDWLVWLVRWKPLSSDGRAACAASCICPLLRKRRKKNGSSAKRQNVSRARLLKKNSGMNLMRNSGFRWNSRGWMHGRSRRSCVRRKAFRMPNWARIRA